MSGFLAAPLHIAQSNVIQWLSLPKYQDDPKFLAKHLLAQQSALVEVAATKTTTKIQHNSSDGLGEPRSWEPTS